MYWQSSGNPQLVTLAIFIIRCWHLCVWELPNEWGWTFRKGVRAFKKGPMLHRFSWTRSFCFALFQGNICVAVYSVYLDTSAWPQSRLEENKFWIIYLPITVTDSSVAGLQPEFLLPLHDSWCCNCGPRVFQACSLPAYGATWSIALIASMGQEASADCRVKRPALAPSLGQHTGATV